MREEQDILFPGDFITNEEMFLPGRGTFAEDGKVKASYFGTLVRDMERRKVRINSIVSVPSSYKKGDTVVGVVQKLRENFAFIEIIPISSKSYRQIPQSVPAVIHVSEVRGGYAKSIGNEMRPGDIIRAKVIDVKPHTIYLSTVGARYGVIKAFCVKCRHPLERRGKVLVCPQCNWKDNRKITEDYRSGRF